MNELMLRIVLIPFYILLFVVNVWYRPNRALVGSTTSADSSGGRWEKAAALPSFRHEAAGAVLENDIYLIGGIALPSVWFPTDLVEVYNAKTDTWRKAPSYPVSVHHTGAAMLGGKIYVVGGNGVRITVRSDVFAFDPEKNVWERKADLPVARGALAVAALDGKLYAVGGGINTVPTNFLHIYNPETDSWSAGKPMPTAREHVSAVGAMGKLFVLGGYAGTRFNNLTTHEAYDPKTDSWETLAPLPYAVSGFTAVALGESIYILGGEQGWAVSSEVHEYKIKENKWIRRPDLPVGRYALAAGVVNGKIHAIGGNPYLMGNEFSRDHDVFTP